MGLCHTPCMGKLHTLVGIALIAIPFVFASAACRDRVAGGDQSGIPSNATATPDATVAEGTPVATTPTQRALVITTGATHGTIKHGGMERTYRLYVPTSATAASSMALVVGLHGGFGWGDQFADNSRFEQLAESEGFIVVFPDGTGRTWNAGNCCGGGVRDKVDDVGFLAALIDHLSATLPVEPGRVFMTGHSNGAMMTFRFACERADKVIAVAPVAGSLEVPGCSPSGPVDLLAIHGDSDKNHPIEGGEGTRSIANVAFVSMADSMRLWTAGFGCTGSPEAKTEGALTATAWKTCAGGATAELVVIAGADHLWPGGKMPERTTSVQGVPSRELDATKAIWAFFESR